MGDRVDDSGAVGGGRAGDGRLPVGGAVYEFGPFRLRLSDRTLFRAGERVRITPRVLDLLVCLVEDSGRVVTKERLLERVWEGTFVEEGNVNRTVSTLRRLLEETDETPYIETIPRQGYRFVAPVKRGAEHEPARAPGEAASSPAPPAADRPVPETAQADPVPAGPAARPSFVRSAFPSRRRLPLAAAAVVLVAAGALAWFDARARETPRSLAVLPFRFAAGAANGETLGVALADAVISRLSRAGALVVRPTSAVLPFRAGRTDPLAAAERLDVEAVLDAEVSQANGRTRIALRLLRRRGGKPLHTESFETGPATLFELQDLVAERVAAALAVPLAPPSGRRDAARLAASDLHVRARRLAAEAHAGDARLDEAIGLFRRAIEADPDFAQAYVGLADALLDRSPKETREAEEAARRALAIDDRFGPAHATLGRIRLLGDARWAEAEAELDRALALEPSYAPAWRWRGTLFTATGRPAEARAAFARALELDPVSVPTLGEAGLVALRQGAVAEARGLLARARAVAPGSPFTAALERAIRETTGW